MVQNNTLKGEQGDLLQAIFSNTLSRILIFVLWSNRVSDIWFVVQFFSTPSTLVTQIPVYYDLYLQNEFICASWSGFNLVPTVPTVPTHSHCLKHQISLGHRRRIQIVAFLNLSGK